MSKLHPRRSESLTEKRLSQLSFLNNPKHAEPYPDKMLLAKVVHSKRVAGRVKLLRSVFSAVHFNSGKFTRPFFPQPLHYHSYGY